MLAETFAEFELTGAPDHLEFRFCVCSSYAVASLNNTDPPRTDMNRSPCKI